jgi:hypothetical protein
MDILVQAQEAVRSAERQLKALLEQALREKRYGELGSISPIAEAIALIVSGFTEADHVAQESPPPSEVLSRASSKKVTYPYFRRDGDKLVKVGWSKKDRQSYEHRAPRETVFQLAAVLSAQVAPGSAFKMEEFLPLRVGKEKELPTYQTYLALAWFRSLGIVEELGKLGYRFKKGALDEKKVEKLWADLQPASQ